MSDSSLKQPGYIKSAAVTGLAFVFLFTISVYGFLYYQASQQSAVITADENARVKLTRGLLMQAFRNPVSDLSAIAEMPATKAFSSQSSKAEKQSLEQIWKVQFDHKPNYSQIRFMDSDGAELIRLDQFSDRSFVTPERFLQSKGGRYYFVQTWALSQGEVYVSPLDLNIEKGLIESPYRPMVRFGVPVFDVHQVKQGVVVLNVLGQPLLDIFTMGMAGAPSAYLVNHDGHVLAGPDPYTEWNFMFGLPAGFKREHPQAWNIIRDSASGKLKTASGLFVYDTVKPLEQIGVRSAGTAAQQNYDWKVVSFVPQEALPATRIFAWSWLCAVYLIGVVLLLIAAFYLHFSRYKRRQLRRAIRQQAKRFQKIASVMGEGLIVMNKAGVITYINPEAEQLLSWQNGELAGQRGHSAFHVHDGRESECPILNVMASGLVYRSKDEEFRRKDGRIIPVSLNAAPLASDTGDEGVVVSFQDFSAIKSYQEEIRALAFQDPLTGLPNRRVLDDRLNLAIRFAHRHNRYLALLFLDLDHFKQVNDTHGHDAGDALLKEIARRLSGCVRETDTVIRVGGDEFIVLLSELSAPDNATIVARKIIEAVGEPVPVAGAEVTVGVSIGIAAASGHRARVDELMLQADAAMYDAKKAGRNTYWLTVLDYSAAP